MFAEIKNTFGNYYCLCFNDSIPVVIGTRIHFFMPGYFMIATGRM